MSCAGLLVQPPSQTHWSNDNPHHLKTNPAAPESVFAHIWNNRHINSTQDLRNHTLSNKDEDIINIETTDTLMFVHSGFPSIDRHSDNAEKSRGMTLALAFPPQGTDALASNPACSAPSEEACISQPMLRPIATGISPALALASAPPNSNLSQQKNKPNSDQQPMLIPDNKSSRETLRHSKEKVK
ncbi:hypothetical protein ASPFODRAFT_27792 [Aspergillus luchuensis CBS 106.47]|uniref:Uncharacterized protein n=1 Tax=Aspergillus luchuensis (strain CBS 106.47) TaxID=1137211 RepID=A0A1M3TYY2_ASPLC|nr:hypothetical protein ASPFODRAFT_27792 [Aspergillus luchuensis CBS 106.47]